MYSRCFRGEWTALKTFIGSGRITPEVLEIFMQSIGLVSEVLISFNPHRCNAIPSIGYCDYSTLSGSFYTFIK